MAIQLTAVSVTAPNVVQLTFGSSMLANPAATEKSNYAFITRFGVDVPLYTKSVAIVSPTVVNVTLTDAMLTAGHYTVAVNGVTGIDGNTIDVTANSLPFEGVGLPLWCFSIKQHAPSWWSKGYGSTLAALLEATGTELDTLAGPGTNSAYTTAQQALSLRTATGSDLSAIASNYGVRRPDFAATDAVFRGLIPLLATQRKSVLKIFYDVLTVLLGPQATANWAIFEVVPNKITIEIPATLLSGFGAATQAGATYLHTDYNVTSAASFPGDYLVTSQTVSDTTVGLNPVILYSGVNNIVDVINQIKAAGIVFSIYAP